MSTIQTAGAGLKTALSTIPGLRVYAPDELPDSVSDFPVALILLGETEYNSDFSQNYTVTFRVIILVSKQDAPSAFNKIFDFIEDSGDKSVTDAIADDTTLGGTCDSSRVVRNMGIGATMWGGILYLSTEFTIEIYL